jgi:hypothetical protein
MILKSDGYDVKSKKTLPAIPPFGQKIPTDLFELFSDVGSLRKI